MSLKGKNVSAADIIGGDRPTDDRCLWWESSDAKALGRAVKTTVDLWWQQHAERRYEYNAIIEQYYGAELGDIGPGNYSPSGRRSGNLRYNIMRSATDTLTSRYSKEKPRPVVLTEKGKWRHRRHARELNKLFYGIFQQNQVYRQGRQVFREAIALNMGVFKTSIHPQTLDIEIERVYPGEFVWDLADAYRGVPSELAQVSSVPRKVLAAKYPDYADAILKAAPARQSENAGRSTVGLVDVVEIWKLPSYRGAKDGRRAVVVDTITVVDEPWEFDRFPVSVMVCSQAFRGYEGNGLGVMLMGFQLSLNTHLQADEEAIERGSRLRCFITGDGVEQQVAKLETDVVGGIYHIKDPSARIQFDPGVTLPPGKTEYNDWIARSAYETIGLTQLSASGAKPAGVDAAVAIRELQDIEALRFMEQQSEYEEMYIDLAKTVWMYVRKYWAGQKKRLKVRGRGFIETVNFDDIDLEDDAFDIAVYAASMLPKQPGARRQTLQEMVANRLITIPQMMVLMDMPDIEGEAELRAAPLSDIDATIARFLEEDPSDERLAEKEVQRELKRISKIKDPDERALRKETLYAELLWEEPIGVESLQEGISRFQEAYLLAKHTDVSPPRLNLLIEWITEAKRLVAEAAMEGQANAIGAGPSGTPGIPGAPQQPQPGQEQPLPPMA
jgi:hypothetical protein